MPICHRLRFVSGGPLKARLCAVALAACLLGGSAFAQQQNPPKSQAKPATAPQHPASTSAKPPAPAEEKPAAQPATEQSGADSGESAQGKFDMTEAAPAVTHHEITVNGKTLKYTATAGRMPIKDNDGKTQALMFYVAYTLDGANPDKRPVTFAFNGGPGSSSIWLHLGALGPRKVVLQENGTLPPSPYRLMDNPYTPLDTTDLVLVDAIGTGFSRPADEKAGKKYWNVKGDVEAFGEFIRMYITRNERWTSPLYLLGESYGTTRAAGVAGYLVNRGVAFNGIMLLSTVLNFETNNETWILTNDVAYPLLLPSYAMVAAYHHKLAPDLMADLNKTRAEVTRWAGNEYLVALNKGDALTPQEHEAIAAQLSRYTGLPKDVVEGAGLRVDVATFTHFLLADQQLRVSRQDGRFTSLDPGGFADTSGYPYDPIAMNTPPFTSVFNAYLRRELGYKTDMPYWVSGRGKGNFHWEWGDADDGFPQTGTSLREAMVADPYLKVMVMEGVYDLATPYLAAEHSMDHLNLPPAYRKNISYARYDSGHMVYLNLPSLKQMHHDVTDFVETSAGPAR